MSKKKGEDAEVETASAISERDAEWARICGLASEVERQTALLAFHAKYPIGEG